MSLPSGAAIAAERNAARRQRAMRDAEEYVRTRIWRMEDDAIAALGQLYLDAYSEMAAQVASLAARYGDSATPDVWSTSDSNFRARTEALLGSIYSDVARLTDDVTASVMDTAVRGYLGGAYGRAWLMDIGLRGVGESALPYLPVEAIRAQMLAPYIGSTFLDRFADARAEFEQSIRKALVESQIRGESIGQAMRRLAQELGLPSGASGYAGRLEMIARTEILRASNLGAMAVYEANQDVLSGWTWLATKDERTCPICGKLDGTVFAFDSKQGAPPAHPRCRCTEVPNLINSALEAAIVGQRETYADWAARRGVSIIDDGGVLRF